MDSVSSDKVVEISQEMLDELVKGLAEVQVSNNWLAGSGLIYRIFKLGLGGMSSLLQRVFKLELPGVKISPQMRVFIWAAFGYLVWRNKYYRNIVDYCVKYLPGFRELVLWWKGPQVKPAAPELTPSSTGHGRMMEAVRAGSQELPLTMSKAQLLVGQKKDGCLVSHGCAVRMRDFLVSPDHVVSYHRRIGETGKLWAFSSAQKDSLKPIDLTEKVIHELDTDLVYMKLTEQEWSVLGVGVMNIMHDIPPQGVYAQVVGHAGLGTTGILNHDMTCFGRVVYDASTFPGYSGAAYVVSGRLAGIHQSGSDAVNGGYSASYIWATLSFNEKFRPEATEDWLRDMYFDKDSWIDIDSTWADLDSVRIKVKGRYHVVDRDSMTKAFGAEWKGKSKLSQKHRRGYEDFEADDKDFPRGLLKSGVSGGPKEGSPASEGDQVLVLTSGFSKLSDEQQKEVLSTLMLQRSKKKRNTPKGLLEKSK